MIYRDIKSHENCDIHKWYIVQYLWQNDEQILQKQIFLNQACLGLWSMCTWFLENVSSANVGVCVCLLLRALVTSHVKGTHNNRIRQFYGNSVSLYDTSVNKLNWHDLSNTALYEHLPKKTKVRNVVLATEVLSGSTNKSKHFKYKDEWANA